MSQQELMPLSGLRSRNFAKKMARYIQSGEVAKRKVAHEMVWWYISETTTRRRPPQIKNTNLEMLVNRIAPLQDFCKHLDTISYARCTWELYSKHIVDFYKFKSGETNKNFVVYDPEQLTRRDFDDFIAHCRQDHQNSENTIKDIFTAMKSYFNFLQENHYIVENFLAKIKIPIVDEKNAVGLSIDEFKQMLAKAKNYRDKVLLLFLFATGARVGEVESFTIPDIHWQTNQVTIFGEKRKRVRSRRLPRPVDIPPHIMTYLKKYIEKDRPIPLKIDEQAVFLNQNRTNLKGRQIEAIVRKIRIAAGIQKKVVVHSFRHACITHLYNNGHGMSIKDIAKHVGHTRESQTYAYIVIIEEERSASYQQTHPLTQSILTNEIAAIIASKEAPQ
jgi:site-specific recombinase XerD